MFTYAADSSAGDGFLIGRHRLCGFTKHLLGNRYRAAVPTQQQAISLQGREVLANGDFRCFKALGQCVHTDLTLLT
ncbi:hypothetical protein D3C81_1888460 [compost metagenome]